MVRKSVPVLVSVLLALSACGGESEQTPDAAAGSSGELREVSVGMLPIMPTAALYAGIEQGFFEDHGLQVAVETGQGGAALLPAVLSGDLEFATSNPVSLLQARARGLDVQVVAHWTSALSSGDADVNAVVAAPDSGIDSAADLEGKQVAVNTLNGMGGLTIREAVRQDGGDPDAVSFLELGFPDMPAALAAGNVDAVWVPEPFLSSLQAEGNTVVTHPSLESVTGHPTQLFFTSGQLAESDPELVADMTAALEETLAYAEENPDAVKAQIPQVLPQLPAEVAQSVRLEEFGTDLRREQLEELGRLMEEDGLIEEPADLDGLLPED
ncbi:ABC transporter substrate-binding protein [Modestobacter sp. VKM Ac-2979]|uniref:ABC transporter substrate-binding protein n=1 Tax=unclassified Modestobacter TaxID=2643866 RepID=UPI0022AB61C9|nr:MULTISPECIES: ABC transporter substrate-binding protein [unclassified Modestobacter]MCZ2813362.1 ABC transporter substrate-binding protein [Modestobacter sp. VKM Ac-2979]MCZ2842446.1 ABC transporter substrate-binding protein [Modestobacter sp. VKM Ac-2980]